MIDKLYSCLLDKFQLNFTEIIENISFHHITMFQHSVLFSNSLYCQNLFQIVDSDLKKRIGNQGQMPDFIVFNG